MQATNPPTMIDASKLATLLLLAERTWPNECRRSSNVWRSVCERLTLHHWIWHRFRQQPTTFGWLTPLDVTWCIRSLMYAYKISYMWYSVSCIVTRMASRVILINVHGDFLACKIYTRGEGWHTRHSQHNDNYGKVELANKRYRCVCAERETTCLYVFHCYCIFALRVRAIDSPRKSHNRNENQSQVQFTSNLFSGLKHQILHIEIHFPETSTTAQSHFKILTLLSWFNCHNIKFKNK